METTKDERRIHTREPRHFELSGGPESGGATARMVASNLSLGGVYCTSDRDFPEMTRLAVRLLLPGRAGDGSPAQPLDLKAVVVRRKGIGGAGEDARFELALLFTALNPFQRERLLRYLSHP